MSAITERISISIQGTVEELKIPLKPFLQVLKEQPGYIRTRWGPQFEDMQKLELLLDWESIEACETFKSSPQFAERMVEMKPLLAGVPTIYYISFVPYALDDVIDSVVVEAITFTDCSAATGDTIRVKVEKARGLSGCTDLVSGLAQGDNAAGNFVAMVGWESLEKSKEADKGYTEGAADVHHVNYNFPVEGFRGL
ncbi:uncharacterized protein BCR38DRAFT_414723 [Pseudomassariella vexata]|uniref:ABM domain-containing protein n=1 Tax=Pseudomassariella vexata TaxID=1141098 RepID=A0A1Y2D9L2_9PEZI|nr:uncharacterized protein BCR38DRAFT_414723 [Pseudomassariella vexata]ORY55864.1 hypothetical protein BCR38DRAFT_414723 [Pseudomassariella vexata]